MMSDQGDFVSYRIEALGLKVEFWKAWPIESNSEPIRSIVFQRVADTGGLVFLRYGDNETIPEFMKTTVDLITTVEASQEEVTTVAGADARRTTFTQTRSPVSVHRIEEERGYAHESVPGARLNNSLLSFTHNGVHVLFGFRVPEESYETYGPILERIINSVAVYD